MSFGESVLTALFCFIVVVIVLAVLCGLIKLFSLIFKINLKNIDFKNIFKKKKSSKQKVVNTPTNNKNDALYATVTDEQGNSTVFKFVSIKSVEENKK